VQSACQSWIGLLVLPSSDALAQNGTLSEVVNFIQWLTRAAIGSPSPTDNDAIELVQAAATRQHENKRSKDARFASFLFMRESHNVCGLAAPRNS
jgi:hypothetical protein